MSLTDSDLDRIAKLCASPDERLEYAARQVAKRFAEELGKPVAATDVVGLLLSGSGAELASSAALPGNTVELLPEAPDAETE